MNPRCIVSAIKAISVAVHIFQPLASGHQCAREIYALIRLLVRTRRFNLPQQMNCLPLLPKLCFIETLLLSILCHQAQQIGVSHFFNFQFSRRYPRIR